MNVAFPTLILFLVLLPGFLLRNGLKRAERSSIDFSPFGQVVASAVPWQSLFTSCTTAAEFARSLIRGRPLFGDLA